MWLLLQVLGDVMHEAARTQNANQSNMWFSEMKRQYVIVTGKLNQDTDCDLQAVTMNDIQAIPFKIRGD